MSAREQGIGGPPPGERGAGAGIMSWLPAVLLGVAAIGVVLVLPAMNHDQSARGWYRGTVGGSSLYRLDVIAARLFPFVVGAGIALAVVQRRTRRRHPAAETGATRVRHELTEVLTHWLNGIGIGLGLLTAVWLRRWFSNPLSLETTYLLHFIGAGLVLAAVAHHLTFQLAGGGAGLLPRSRSDFKNALAELIGYTGVYRGLRGAFGVQLPAAIRRPLQRPLRRMNLVPDPNGKYLATEKVLSYTIWAVLIGVVVITGIIKTLNYLFVLPGALRQPATYLHDLATIFLLIFLCIHVGALVLVPRNWPLLRSMFTTRISRAYARQHLSRWQDDAVAEPSLADGDS